MTEEADLKEHDIDTRTYWRRGHWLALPQDCRAGDLWMTKGAHWRSSRCSLQSNMPLRTDDVVVSGIVVPTGRDG